MSKKQIEITNEELDFKLSKAKLSMWIDGDILHAIREETKKMTGTEKGYQTYLNKRLRELFLGEDNGLKKIKELEKRISIIEKTVLRKRA